MTKDKAIQKMREGCKVTHKYFSRDEWMTISPDNRILFEDGVMETISEFFEDRPNSIWDDGYSVIEEPEKQLYTKTEVINLIKQYECERLKEEFNPIHALRWCDKNL